MAFEFIVYGICLITLFIGSYTDLKTREVPDWVNYGLIIVGLGLNALFSAFSSDWSYMINSIVGFAIMFAIAYLMFYTGQWGGGDSKMLMGLGAMLGFEVSLKNLFIANLFVNMLIFGAIYGLIFSFILAVRNWKGFRKELDKIAMERRFLRYRIYMRLAFAAALIAVLGFIMQDRRQVMLLLAPLSIVFIFYLVVIVKAIEKVCMFKYVKPDELTEGDWIAKKVIVEGKIITGPKDLGIEKKNIKRLIQLYNQGKVKKILVKEGIPFVPSFFIAFIMTILYGNIILLFV